MTIQKFNDMFPDDDRCLQYIFDLRFGACPECSGKMYRIRNRKAYVCSKGHQVSPTAWTPFHKSSTPLKSWFYAIYLMNSSKNGLASQELMRHIGTTYKTAWRITKTIRDCLWQRRKPLEGIVEMDEVYIGGKGRTKGRGTSKIPVVGMLERGGPVRAFVVEDIMKLTMVDLLIDHVKRGTLVITDEFASYKGINMHGYPHKWINHSKGKYVDGEIHTNGIESFWSQLKRSIHGTHHSVSPQHLQSYLDYFVFQYNNRTNPFEALVSSLFLSPGLRVEKSFPLVS